MLGMSGDTNNKQVLDAPRKDNEMGSPTTLKTISAKIKVSCHKLMTIKLDIANYLKLSSPKD